MKCLNIILAIFLLMPVFSFAQSLKPSSKFRFFNRTELNYGFGINQTFSNKKVNVFQIKTVFGKQNNRLGAGLGVATSTYRNGASGSGVQFNTVAFSADFHSLLFKIYEDRDNFYVKASIGHAARIFNGYDKGFRYDASLGRLITNKRGAKYFVEVQYQTQYFDDFLYNTHSVKAETIGLGVGIWL